MKAGDRITWKSQAGGSWKEKTGIVIAEVPAKDSAMQHVPNNAKKSHIKFDLDRAAIDRVLVAVPAGKDGGITHYYCPSKAILISQGNGK